MPTKPKLSADEILKAEFEYIVATATQASEDRSKVASFYFVSVGSLIAAIFSTQVLNSAAISGEIYFAFTLLFVFLTTLGYLTIAQLARLRTAWMDSVKAMNQIKTYYIQHVGDGLKPAFLWTNDNAPKGYKKGSVANYLAYQVASLSGVIFSAAVLFFCLSLGLRTPYLLWVIPILPGILMGRFQLGQYRKIVEKE
ncbi:MAG: hypothetical protein Kow002_16010 [Anaerolineales bacterium]